jgi:hypothetical protein
MKERKGMKAKGIQIITAIDKCLMRVLNINVKFWKTYETIDESKMLYRIEIWTVRGGWKYTDGIQGRIFLKESPKKSKEHRKCSSRMGTW